MICSLPQVYYERITTCEELDEITSNNCSFAKEVTVNGITFSPELWLPIFADNSCKINEVIEILFLDRKDISKMFAVCKSYAATYNRHFEGYNVDIKSLKQELTVLNIKKYMDQQHQYPVKLHNINDEILFRCKRF